MRRDNKHVYRSSLSRMLHSLVGHPRLGAEVGVHQGELSKHLLDRFRHLRLVLVDPWTESPRDSAWRRTGDKLAQLTQAEHEENYRATIGRVKRFFRRAIILRMLSVKAAAQAKRRYGLFDFVFLDGDHSAESLRLDLSCWWPLVKPGGLLCGHDYNGRNKPQVKEVVDAMGFLHGLEVHAWKGRLWGIQKP